MQKTKMRFVVYLIVTALVCCPVAFATDVANPININTADAETLTQLKRVGVKYAAAIVKYREENGPFEKIEDITLVPGIGEKTLELNKERIIVTEDVTEEKKP